ncbi:hypothetical protein KP509_39G054700 [Ceratopteris richardii]|nr:hypothetical protein KP509_39G054700 [Ceratopteris richardii]
MERFVRFVSTPEVLERVSSVEVELLELEETTRKQSSETNEGNGAGQVENSSSKIITLQLSPGGKSAGIASLDKPAKVSSDGGEIGSEESSKHRLLRALDARRMMLQKEQGMAFARALAAGFNVDNMDDLISFAECFGAERLKEACIKFMAFVKKRQEAGLGLEDLELMAAESVQADMLYMGGAVGGNAMGIVWPSPQGNGHDLSHILSASNEGKNILSEANAEQGAEERTGSKPSGGDSEGAAGVVKGHPMMATWQGQPHNQFIPGVPPYGSLHPGMPNPSFGFTGPVQPGQVGLHYPHYMGGPYVPYHDGNGWQAHTSVQPHYWPGNQASETSDGVHHPSRFHQGFSPPSAREQEIQLSTNHAGDWHEDGEDYLNDHSSEFSGRSIRRSSSPRRRSASPMRKVQIGRSGGSKRSGMVVIKNINYITPKPKHQGNKEEDASDNSDSWIEDDESDEDETLRASIEDAVGIVEGKIHVTRDGRQRHRKKDRKKTASKVIASPAADNDDDDEEEDKKPGSEYVWVIDRQTKGTDDSTKFLSEQGNLLENGVKMESPFDPALENVPVVKKGLANVKDSNVGEDPLLSERNGHSRVNQSQSYGMFEQEHHESKKETVVDDSYMLANSGRSATMSKGHETMDFDYDLSSKERENFQQSEKLPDDSFIVLERPIEKESTIRDWRMSLNLESEMPINQNPDASESSAPGMRNTEPDDLFMVQDRISDTYRKSWNSPLDYDMQVLASDLINHGNCREDNEIVTAGDGSVLEEDEERPSEPVTKKLSEKDAKEKSMKEMLQKRKSVAGGRPGRPNPLAEAQLRAEKLRQYKAGLQKSKKEKEEEERKRIEDLRIQRQQRIAARSNSTGAGPSSPSPNQASRTRPSISKLPSKVPSKGSLLSPSVNRERLANGSRLVHSSMDNPKPTQSPVIRSISSVSELHREAKKPTSVLRASTGSQSVSLSMRNEKQSVLNSHGKPNGPVENKVDRAKSSRIDDRVSRGDSGLAEKRVGKSLSSRSEGKLGLAESVQTVVREISSENSHAPEKSLPSAAKSLKRDAPYNGSGLQVSSPKGTLVDGKAAKKTSTTALKSMPVAVAVAQKQTAQSQTVSVDIAELESKSSSSSKQEVFNVEDKLESAMRTTECKESFLTVVNENGLCIQNGNLHQRDIPHASKALGAEKAGHDNDFLISNATLAISEHSKEELSCKQAGSLASSDDRQLEVEVNSSVGEESHARVAHGSPSDENHHEVTEGDIFTEEHFVGDYSPPFAPPSGYSISPTVQLTPEGPRTQQQQVTSAESNVNEASSMRSRKKWGDSKAKGLKRLLLLGRKSGHSSHNNTADMASEGDEEDTSLSNGKNMNLNFSNDQDNLNDQGNAAPVQNDLGHLNSNKGSKSIFSLSTFRSKNAVKT